MVKITRQRITLFLLLAVVFFMVQTSLPQKAHGQSNVYVASLDQNIDPGSEDFVVSSINDATSSRMHSFILILNTNGGSGANMENIISAISNYETNGNNNFTTLVAPSSAHAFSAGAYIAEASSSIFMVPGTVIGSATPIVSGIPTGEENTTLTKDINAFTQYMTALTGSHGRNATNAALMVTHGVSYDCQTVPSCSARQKGVIDQVLPANSTQQALTIMHAGDATIHYPGTRSVFLSIISDPNLDSILFLAGVFGSIYLYRVRETLMHRPPAQNPKAIIGKIGRLTSDLKAGGVATANIGAEDFTVSGSMDLPSGTRVRVKDIEGLRLTVEKVDS